MFPSECPFNYKVMPSFAFPVSSVQEFETISRANSFVFTIKANEFSSNRCSLTPNGNKEVLYCCCVHFGK